MVVCALRLQSILHSKHIFLLEFQLLLSGIPNTRSILVFESHLVESQKLITCPLQIAHRISLADCHLPPFGGLVANLALKSAAKTEGKASNVFLNQYCR